MIFGLVFDVILFDDFQNISMYGPVECGPSTSESVRRDRSEIDFSEICGSSDSFFVDDLLPHVEFRHISCTLCHRPPNDKAFRLGLSPDADFFSQPVQYPCLEVHR